MIKYVKIVALIILTITILVIGELILSHKNESYKSWKKVRTWNSRMKGLKFSKIELTGHWHLTRNNNEEKGIIDLYNTLDFTHDSIVILGKNFNESEGFYGIYNNDQIRFNNTDIKANFEYTRISNNELNIKSNNYGQYIASRCNANCCNHQIHFFHPSNVHLDLPIILQGEEYHERIERSLEFPIYVGLPKSMIRENTNEDFKVEVSGEFITISLLSLIEEEFKLKVPDIKENRIYRVIYADKNTPIKLLEELIHQLKKGSKKKIFFALRNEDSTKKINIYLKKVDEFRISDELILEEWLNK